jgi:hypothetical protein
MRRFLQFLVMAALVACPLLAQRGGGGHGGGGGMRGGGATFHGGGGGSGFHGGSAGGFRGGVGFRGNTGFRRNFVFRGNRFVGFSPFFYSGFYGGYPFWDPSYDNSGYGYGYASAPDPYAGSYGYNSDWYPPAQSYTAPIPPPPPPAPVIKEYVWPPSQAQSTEPPLYLIAFQDGVIRAVAAYWVDGATLHYVSMDHEQKQAPLSSVDRMLSERLNRERNVTFQLPR